MTDMTRCWKCWHYFLDDVKHDCDEIQKQDVLDTQERKRREAITRSLEECNLRNLGIEVKGVNTWAIFQR